MGNHRLLSQFIPEVDPPKLLHADTGGMQVACGRFARVSRVDHQLLVDVEGFTVVALPHQCLRCGLGGGQKLSSLLGFGRTEHVAQANDAGHYEDAGDLHFFFLFFFGCGYVKTGPFSRDVAGRGLNLQMGALPLGVRGGGDVGFSATQAHTGRPQNLVVGIEGGQETPP